MRNLIRSSALEVCRVVGNELVTVLVDEVDGEVEWSYSSTSSSGRGKFDGHPVAAYDAAFAAAAKALVDPQPKHSGPLFVSSNRKTGEAVVLEILGNMKGTKQVGPKFSSKRAAVEFLDDYKLKLAA